MKNILIGIHFRKHDANISIFDGNKFHYFQREREEQGEKRCGIGFKKQEFIQDFPGKDFTKYIINYLKKLNIEKNQILAIAVGDSSWELKIENNYFQKVSWLKDLCEEVYFVDHHYAHHLSTFKNNNSWVLDGHGNDLRFSSIFKDKELEHTLREPNEGESLGERLDSVGIELTGSWGNAGHMMALDSLGVCQKEFYEKHKNNMMENSWNYLSFRKFCSYWQKNKKWSEADNLYRDYIKTIHEIVKNIYPVYLNRFFKKNESFIFSGGVSQNIILNTHLKKMFPNIEITPHGFDGGISLGLVQFLIDLKKYDPPNLKNFPFIQADEHPGFPKESTIQEAAEYLAQGKIILWYQGNGEIGPRALGNRSILGNPLIKDMKEQINNKVKKRAWYRPYGASVLKEDYQDYFNLDWESPYMLYQAEVKDKEKLKPITHFDGTCRIQTVDPNHFVFYELLQKFKKLTGVSTLINTSFNLPGKPIVGTKKDAKDTFNSSQADVLIVGDEVYLR